MKRPPINPFARRRRGTETLEWGLVLGLVVIGAVAAMSQLGGTVAEYYSHSAQAIDDALPGDTNAAAAARGNNGNGGNGNGAGNNNAGGNNNGNHNGNGNAGGNGNGNNNPGQKGKGNK